MFYLQVSLTYHGTNGDLCGENPIFKLVIAVPLLSSCLTKFGNWRNNTAQGADCLFCLWLDYPDFNPPSESFLTAKNKEGGESGPVGGPSRLAIFKPSAPLRQLSGHLYFIVMW